MSDSANNFTNFIYEKIETFNPEGNCDFIFCNQDQYYEIGLRNYCKIVDGNTYAGTVINILESKLVTNPKCKSLNPDIIAIKYVT